MSVQCGCCLIGIRRFYTSLCQEDSIIARTPNRINTGANLQIELDFEVEEFCLRTKKPRPSDRG